MYVDNLDQLAGEGTNLAVAFSIRGEIRLVPLERCTDARSALAEAEAVLIGVCGTVGTEAKFEPEHPVSAAMAFSIGVAYQSIVEPSPSPVYDWTRRRY